MAAADVQSSSSSQQATGGKKKRRPKRNQAQIPLWWMEITPHNTLDVEDEKTRRLYEERMALLYAEQAEEDAEKGMMFDIDGNPLTEEEASVAASTGHSGWKGRQDKSGEDGDGEEKPLRIMFGGRNFKPGSPGWDPRQWGIDADDEDFEQYQTGAKLPDQYVTAMTNYAKATGKYRDPGADYGKGLRSTEGVYGRMGENPEFQPEWAKKKLRSTTQGQTIRHGIYNDSPNKHLKYRANAHRKDDEEDAAQQQQQQEEEEEQPDEVVEEQVEEEEIMEEEEVDDAPPEPKPKTFSAHSDYYYNSTTPDAGTKAATPTASNKSSIRQPEEAPVGLTDPDDAAEDEEEEEYYEDEDLIVEVEEETVYEEEVTVEGAEEEEEAPANDQSLEDLQATLAAKMAELKRLQGM